MMTIYSTWRIEDGRVAVVCADPDARHTRATKSHRESLHRALAELGRVTHCRIGRVANDAGIGTVHWNSFRVLERWGFARRAFGEYVAITDLGRVALRACQTGRVGSSSSEVRTT